MSRTNTSLSGASILLDLHPLHVEAAAKRGGSVDGVGPPEPLRDLDKQLRIPTEDPDSKSPLPPSARMARESAALGARSFPNEADLPEPLYRIVFDLEKMCLHISAGEGFDRDEAERIGSLEVPLLKAEVAHAPLGPDRNIVSIVPHVAPPSEDEVVSADALSVWLVVIEGEEGSLLSVLDTLSFLGAVRTGLAESFVLSTKELGSGGCATVYLAHSRGGGLSVRTPTAIKLAREPGSKADKALMREMPLVVAAQGHINIVRFLGLFRASDALVKGSMQWALALELCPGGDLQELVAARGPQNEAVCATIISGVLAAIAHIHEAGVVHRDVKSENILLAEGGKPVLTDFGVAAFLSDTTAMATRCGSAGYVAPEVLKADRKYDSKVDVFGVGVTLYFMLSGTLPFTGQDVAQVLRRNLRCKICLEVCHQFRQVDMWAKNFLLLLLQANPEDRPTAAAALLHTWLTGHRDSKNTVVIPMKNAPTAPPAQTNSEDVEETLSKQRQSAPGNMGQRRAPLPPTSPRGPENAPAPSRRWRQAKTSTASSDMQAQDSAKSPTSPGSNSKTSYDQGGMSLRPRGADDEEQMVMADLLEDGETPRARRRSHRHPTAPAQPPPDRSSGSRGGRPLRAMVPQAPAAHAPNFEMQGSDSTGPGNHRRWRLLSGGFGGGGWSSSSNANPSHTLHDDAGSEVGDRSSHRGWESFGCFSVAGSGVNTPRTSFRGSFARGVSSGGGGARGNSFGAPMGERGSHMSDSGERNGSFLSRISFGSNRGGSMTSPRQEEDRSSRGSFRSFRKNQMGQNAKSPEPDDDAPGSSQQKSPSGRKDVDSYEERRSFGEPTGPNRISNVSGCSSQRRDDPDHMEDPLDVASDRQGSKGNSVRFNLQRLRQKYANKDTDGPPSGISDGSNAGAGHDAFDPHGDALFDPSTNERRQGPSPDVFYPPPVPQKPPTPKNAQEELLVHPSSSTAPSPSGPSSGTHGNSRIVSQDSNGSSPLAPVLSRRGNKAHTTGTTSSVGSATRSVEHVQTPRHNDFDDDNPSNMEADWSTQPNNISCDNADDPRRHLSGSSVNGAHASNGTASWLTNSRSKTKRSNTSSDKGGAAGASQSSGVLPPPTRDDSTKAAAAAAAAAVAEASIAARNGSSGSKQTPTQSEPADMTDRGTDSRSVRPTRSLRGRLGSLVKGTLGR